MTTNHHTEITEGAVANADTVNDPLAELDSAITDTQAYAPDELTGTNTDIETNNVTSSAHGFAPKLSNVDTEYLDGEGNWTVPVGTGASVDGHAITEEGGADLPQRAKLDFIGASVTASNGVSATEININGAKLLKNVEALTGAAALTDASDPIQSLDTNGAARDVTLPAEAATNPVFIIHNAGGDGDDLTVEDDGTNTIAIIADGEIKTFVSNGTSWYCYATTTADSISIADAGDIITATDVEGALQENRTALDLNTTHRTSNGTDHSYIDQDVTTTGTPTHQSATFTRQVVINEGGGDYDTRIEGDTNENLFYVDAGNDRIGIGTASPVQMLHLYQSGATDVMLRLESDGKQAALLIDSGGTGGNADAALIFYHQGVNKWQIYNDGDDSHKFKINDDGDVRLTIQQDGKVGIGTTSPGVQLAVNGSVSKTGGSFLIDHPLFPTEKLLRYGFVEAPRYDLVHRGTITLVNGKATVDIDKEYGMITGTFDALTQDAKVMSVQAVDSFVRVKAGVISKGQFVIEAEDLSFVGDVNWFVLAERADQYAKWENITDENGHIINEVEKEMPTEGLLDDRIEYVKDKSDIREKIETIDTSNLKGYYRSREAYGQNPLTRKIIKVLEGTKL